MFTQHFFSSFILSGLILTGFGLSQSAYAEPSAGEHLYTENCSVCHGSNGGGGVGIPLNLDSFQNSISDDYLVKTIKHGRIGRIMPSFKKLGDKKIKALVKYIRSFTHVKAATFDPTPIKGNIQHGKTLFKNKCTRCHGKYAKGGQGTGVTFSRPRDLSIIPPALNNAGFLASASDEMIKHTLMNGRDKTPMNSFLKQGLSESDINDVVAYIRHFETQKISKLHEEKLNPIIVEDSPYSLERTLANLKKAVIGENFRIIRQQTLDNGLAAKGKQNKKQIILYFCNFQFLNEALALDPRIGLFLPCRITIVQQGNSVKVMAINPLRLSKLFNNSELDAACKSMSNTYTDILEEATL